MKCTDAMVEVRISCEYGDYAFYACKELKTNDTENELWRQQENPAKEERSSKIKVYPNPLS